ncbi:hypothetical protein ACIBKZ_15695 [Streptomyces sp. NPDC050421]|uniref:hypothetical protein n=1 Tax=Streptomyces sp. NPDC050421 TaxID=3365613 RepID=UPI0037AC3C4A
MTKNFSTFDGGTVGVTRFGYTVEFHYRNAAGDTVATVEMSDDDAAGLFEALDAITA